MKYPKNAKPRQEIILNSIQDKTINPGTNILSLPSGFLLIEFTQIPPKIPIDKPKTPREIITNCKNETISLMYNPNINNSSIYAI